MKFIPSACLTLMGCISFNLSGQEAAISIEANRVAEISFEAETSRGNPFLEIELDVVFTDPQGVRKTVPAFWAGGDRWKARYASPILGAHRYRTQCSDTRDKGLHGIEGRVEIKPYGGNNPFYRHGPIQVSQNRRYFEHADGTPFFWLGDTWWKGMAKRLPWEGYQELTLDRRKKGFSVVQIIIGPYPDEPEFDPRWENEGGMPYDRTYRRINPEYFKFADRRIEHLVKQGIAPAIFGAWGYHMKSLGAENMSRYWRYLVARYGAYPVIWSIGGEVFKGPREQWIKTGDYVRSIDPYRRPTTLHSRWAKGFIPSEYLDFDMLMPGQGGAFGEMPHLGQWDHTPKRTTAFVQASYALEPTMPVVIGEICYEDHMMTNDAVLQRQVFWSSILLGARGFTYGAEGLWQMTSETARGSEYAFTPWSEAMHYRGSTQLGQGKKFLQGYPWWKLEPHPEWVEPHATIFETAPDKTWNHQIAQQEFERQNGRWDLPYAAGIPGELHIIYIPGHYYDWDAPTVKGLEPNVPYHAFLYDPARAKRYELGLVVNTGSAEVTDDQMEKLRKLYASVDQGQAFVMHDDPFNSRVWAVKLPEIHLLEDGNFKLERLPAPQDWVMVLERVNGQNEK